MNPWKKLALALTASSLALAAAPALASSEQTVQISVSYADLDLDRAEGVSALYGRLEAAAEQTCDPAEGQSLAMRRIHRDCMRESLDGAIASLDNDALSMLHLAKTGRVAGATSVAKQ